MSRKLIHARYFIALAVALAPIFICGCGGGSVNGAKLATGAVAPANTPDSSLPKWTFLMYINGDTCDVIEGPSLVPVSEVEEVGSNADINVIVQRDQCRNALPTNNVQRLYVRKGEGASTVLADLGEQDMGDVDTLIDFISWAKQEYPAQHYVLYFYGHGSGWYIENPEWVEPAAARTAGGFIYDYNGSQYNYASAMDVNQLRYALQTAKLHPDIIVFGPCLMGGVEVAYELRNAADIMVASQDITAYFGGGVYKTILQTMVDNPDITARALSALIVELFIDSLRQRGSSGVYTMVMAAVDLSKMDALAAAIDAWGRALEPIAAATRPTISATLSSDYSYYRDLGHFARLQDTPQARAVLAALDDAIVYFDYNGSDVANATGLSIYLERDTSRMLYRGYQKLLFSKEVTGWMNYLLALAG